MASLNNVEAGFEAGNSTLRDYLELLKPGVMSLVVFTGAVGMLIAPGKLHPFLFLLAIFCIAVGAGASGAINMWYDRDIDQLMKRTAMRPIPTGRIEADEVLAFGVVLSVFSVLTLGVATNWVAGGLLLLAILFYVFVYTMWLKRSTVQNIVIGGAAGALPPMIGWAAVTGDVSMLPVMLFLIIFFWTPPHFWALAVCKAGEYGHAGVPMLPVVRGIRSTKRHVFCYALVLLAVSLVPYGLGLLGGIYAGVAFAFGAIFCIMSYQNLKLEGNGNSGSIFAYSILYLFILFGAVALDRLAIAFTQN